MYHAPYDQKRPLPIEWPPTQSCEMAGQIMLYPYICPVVLLCPCIPVLLMGYYSCVCVCVCVYVCVCVCERERETSVMYMCVCMCTFCCRINIYIFRKGVQC